jgi:hypothetical protein
MNVLWLADTQAGVGTLVYLMLKPRAGCPWGCPGTQIWALEQGGPPRLPASPSSTTGPGLGRGKALTAVQECPAPGLPGFLEWGRCWEQPVSSGRSCRGTVLGMHNHWLPLCFPTHTHLSCFVSKYKGHMKMSTRSQLSVLARKCVEWQLSISAGLAGHWSPTMYPVHSAAEPAHLGKLGKRSSQVSAREGRHR